MKFSVRVKNLKRTVKHLQEEAIKTGLDSSLIGDYTYISNYNYEIYTRKRSNRKLIIGIVFFFIFTVVCSFIINSFLGARCFIPSNYLVWEVTRPLSDCNYCRNVTKPIILRNITRDKFEMYAYSSRPIIVKNAITHWRAMRKFDFNFFKKLYEETAGSYDSLDDGCQFLNFKTDLFTLEEVFKMSDARAQNEPGEEPWYVGWGNCHPDILSKVRQYYSVPEFLPEDAEFPATENIFFGYEIGAVMHLDYIPRLMWQGQVKGNKSWHIAPVPECEDVCTQFKYYVEPGDVVLLDTRLWYHATKIPKGEFSLTVQSEYG